MLGPDRSRGSDLGAAAIERAKGFWKVFGHAGAIALVRTGFPETTTTVLRSFGSVPEQLEI